MTEPRKDRKTVDLSAMAGVLKMHREALDNAKRWKDVADEYAKQLKEAIGSAEVLVAFGKEVGTFAPQDRFAGAQFKRDYPDIARTFEVSVVKTELNVEAIKREQPDLYSQYQVRALENKYGR